MRIALNAQKLSFAQQYHAGGISRYIYHLLAELPGVSPAHRYRAFVSQAPVDTALAHHALRFSPSPFPTESPLLRILWEQLVLPAQLLDGVDLFHGLAYALSLAWPKRSVVTIFDLSFLRHPEHLNRPNRLYLTFSTRLSTRRAARIFTISQHARAEAVELLGVPPDRVVTTYCGVDQRFRPIATSELRAFRSAKQLPERFVLYLGTLEPRKNVATLVKAYARMRQAWPEAPLLVLAGGQGWKYQPILDAIRASGLAEQVRLVGYVPADELALWYNAAGLFVYPSLYEGFGLPPLEAMACGTAVVASRAASLPEVVGEAGLLVNPLDEQALAEAMRQALQDDGLRHRMSEAGLEQSRQFSWQRMARETVAVYDELADGA